MQLREVAASDEFPGILSGLAGAVFNNCRLRRNANNEMAKYFRSIKYVVFCSLYLCCTRMLKRCCEIFYFVSAWGLSLIHI